MDPDGLADFPLNPLDVFPEAVRHMPVQVLKQLSQLVHPIKRKRQPVLQMDDELIRRDLECRNVVNGIGRNEALVERKFRQVIKNAHGVSACGAGSTKFHVDMMGSDKERSASGIDDER
ncbi:MAG: hypothetical protein M3N91_14420 [Pseudomonadota bacterium]|nr:hypothetical protein [Pseudomonadota bacterium]